MSRASKPIASDLFASGWLPPRSAAAALGITEAVLLKRWRNGEIKRRYIGPGCFLYEVAR